MVIGKSIIYQRSSEIVAGSLFALLVLITVADNTAKNSKVYTGGFAKCAGLLADYQVNTVNSAFIKDIFSIGAG